MFQVFFLRVLFISDPRLLYISHQVLLKAWQAGDLWLLVASRAGLVP